jgi:hypothetical protein
VTRRKPARPPSKEEVKRVADRAEARAAGKDPNALPQDSKAVKTKKAPKGAKSTKAPKKPKAAKPRPDEPSEADEAMVAGFVDALLGGGAAPPSPFREPRVYRQPMGRPPTYKPEYAAIAKAMCKLGATDYELAQEFEVTTSTIWRWSVAHDDFCSALKVGKDMYDDRIERNLAQRALGYTFNATKVMQNNGTPVYAEYTEHMPPDPGAAKIWLANRRPDKWREKTVTEITGKDGGAIEFSSTVREDIERRIVSLSERRKQPSGNVVGGLKS